MVTPRNRLNSGQIAINPLIGEVSMGVGGQHCACQTTAHSMAMAQPILVGSSGSLGSADSLNATLIMPAQLVGCAR